MRKRQEKRCTAFCLQRQVLSVNKKGHEQLIITRVSLSVDNGTMLMPMSVSEIQEQFPGWKVAGFMSEEEEC